MWELDGPKGGCLQPDLPTVPPLCLPVHSQAVGEILHERVQAGEGEDRQDGKGQLKEEGDEVVMAARLGYLGAGDALPPPYQDALQDVEQVIHACEVADILESSHKDSGQDGKGAGEEHPGEAGPAELQEALEHGKTCILAVPGAPRRGDPPGPGWNLEGISPSCPARALSVLLQGCWAPLGVSSDSLTEDLIRETLRGVPTGCSGWALSPSQLPGNRDAGASKLPPTS